MCIGTCFFVFILMVIVLNNSQQYRWEQPQQLHSTTARRWRRRVNPRILYKTAQFGALLRSFMNFMWNLDYEKFTIIWTFCKFGTYKSQHPYYLFPCIPHLWIYIYHTHADRNLKVLYNDWYLIITVEAWYKKDNNFFQRKLINFPFWRAVFS